MTEKYEYVHDWNYAVFVWNMHCMFKALSHVYTNPERLKPNPDQLKPNILFYTTFRTHETRVV